MAPAAHNGASNGWRFSCRQDQRLPMLICAWLYPDDAPSTPPGQSQAARLGWGRWKPASLVLRCRSAIAAQRRYYMTVLAAAACSPFDRTGTTSARGVP